MMVNLVHRKERRSFLYNLEKSTKRFTCYTCNKSYAHKANLMRHCKFECNKEPRFRCNNCSYKTFYNFHLKSHMVNCNRKYRFV